MRLIFQHIPRTGGTALCAIARQWCEREGIPCLTFDQAHAPPSIDLPESCFVSAHNLTTDYRSWKGRWFTLLRDPIDRVISEWQYIRDTPEHHCHVYAKTSNWLPFTLAHRADNIMVRNILGEFSDRLRPDSWQRAVDRLQGMEFAVRNHSEFIADLFGTAGEWREPFRYYPSAMQLRSVMRHVAQDLNLWRALT